jgi:hypothetical protein
MAACGDGWTWWRPSLVAAAFYGALTIALLATHAWDPRFFATVGPEWQRHDPRLAKQADGMIFFNYAVDPMAAARAVVVVFATSACWTAAVAVRFLVWDVALW